jgi:hypothetical protein
MKRLRRAAVEDGTRTGRQPPRLRLPAGRAGALRGVAFSDRPATVHETRRYPETRSSPTFAAGNGTRIEARRHRRRGQRPVATIAGAKRGSTR